MSSPNSSAISRTGGAGQSPIIANATDATARKYAALSLSKSDRIRFLGFPEEVYQEAEFVLTSSWPPGIKAASQYAGSHEYQMKGRPWGLMGTNEAVGSRVLLRNILAYLYDRSWRLTTSISLSEKIGSKDTLLFKNAASGNPEVEWLVIQFHSSNKIFVHCPWSPAASVAHSRSDANTSLMKSVENCLTKLEYLEKGEWSQNHDAYQFSLKGRPWRCHGQDSMKVRKLLLELAESLDESGWENYGTIKQRSESDDWRVCDSWYLVRKVSILV
ncbi:hypothetical protein BKA67DRAFT_565041 [Truncatella angustata]|uniref:Uncharacterized protein n=1 Tax=Truncatella angustata TaxID=152316 RepID=A0A9P8ULQ1_9PEZI|nr:uncharacterized protein BKA67DRAFT_565041 [Truncatella angustata]KAH6654413.1 hypothetical protein BKA67DRAFT_565041 [Truncatella angustata]